METERYKAFFFEAMNAGWASDKKKESIPQLPGVKTIPYTKDDLSLMDYYFVAPGSKFSYGTTIIWLSERPVWVMHYGGWYEKGVIPFLKRALRSNYEESIFLGGRGPRIFEGDDHRLQYLNWNEENDFTNFNGYEQILTTSNNRFDSSVGQKMGEHHYFGGMML